MTTIPWLVKSLPWLRRPLIILAPVPPLPSSLTTLLKICPVGHADLPIPHTQRSYSPSGSLYLLFFLPGMLFPHVSEWFTLISFISLLKLQIISKGLHDNHKKIPFLVTLCPPYPALFFFRALITINCIY